MPHPMIHEPACIANIMKGSSYLVSACLVTVDFTEASIAFMNENVGTGGWVLGIATFGLNWYYKKKDENRKQRIEDKELSGTADKKETL